MGNQSLKAPGWRLEENQGKGIRMKLFAVRLDLGRVDMGLDSNIKWIARHQDCGQGWVRGDQSLRRASK